MSFTSEQLSAYLDGELPANDARQLEEALAHDPALQAEMEALMAADTLAQTEFSDALAAPLPDHLVNAITAATAATGAMPRVELPDGKPSPIQRSGIKPWMMAAAAAVMLIVGSVGGYVAGLNTVPGQQQAAVPVWLADIADYHAVYASQSRHLVEVGADEADHIQTWLTGTLGADVRIPDLTDHGLSFQGARLLVAAGKPVAQLMYLDGDGRVVALCQIQTAEPSDSLAERTIGGFDLVSWGGDDSNFVIVGDEGREGLTDIALTAATQV